MFGSTVKDVSAQHFIKAFAEHLKRTNKIELPSWHDIVKTGKHKELCPVDPDWYYIRAASIARHLYIRPGAGVGAFTKVYGGKQRKTRVTRVPHFSRAASGLIRKILQQLTEADIVGLKKDKKGRFLTEQGKRELDTVARQILKARFAAAKAAQLSAAATTSGTIEVVKPSKKSAHVAAETPVTEEVAEEVEAQAEPQEAEPEDFAS